MEMKQQIHALAKEIYDITHSLKMTGEPDIAEQEIEAFTIMVDKREPLIKKFTQLIGDFKNGMEDKEIKQLISSIIDLEKEHVMIMEHVKKSLSKSIRDIKKGQNINNAYAYQTMEESSGLFDAKQ